MHLEHLNLTVTDLDRSVAFYTALLDLNVRWSGTSGAGPTTRRSIHLGAADWYLALSESLEAEPGRLSRNLLAPGFNHLGFVVDDLDAARERLDELGVTPHSEQSYDPGRRLYFVDPDGIEVELVEYDAAATA